MSGAIEAWNNVNSNRAVQQAAMLYEESQVKITTLEAELQRAREEAALEKEKVKTLAVRVEGLKEQLHGAAQKITRHQEHFERQLQTAKERMTRDQEAYAKEIKKCRKDAYRAEIKEVEARQDLQASRSELRRCQAELQHEKSEKEKSRQESFERAYALAGMVGENEQLKDRLRALEKERDAAALERRVTVVEARDTSEDDVFVPNPNEQREKSATSESEDQSEGGIPLEARRPAISASVNVEEPAPSFAPPFPSFDSIRFRLEYYDKKIEGQDVSVEEENEFLKQELSYARRKHAEDEEVIHFMHMQCQFKACPCRLAESNGDVFVHDVAYQANTEEERIPKKRKISGTETIHPLRAGGNVRPAGLTSGGGRTAESTPQAEASHRDHSAALPPEPSPGALSGTSDESPLLQEAAEIPLPEAQPMELDARDSSLGLTAQLEDITQVLVEPGTASKGFCFSTSTASNPGFQAATPAFRAVENPPSAALDHDLFDLSPPKQAPPRRPSTAMGILTVDSPIRLVPDSPRSARSLQQQHTQGESNHTTTRSVTTTTTKIALKDSPVRSGLHRRAQSRPDIRSHSPLVAGVSHGGDDEQTVEGFVKETSASPAPSTLFPITPVHRQKSSHGLQQAPSQGRPSPVKLASTTVTTRVPLRDLASNEEEGFVHAQTEVLHVDVNPHVNDTSTTGRELRAGNASILGNVPGTPISREAALAQIRARRDRARSVNLKRSTDTTAGPKGSPQKPRAVNGVLGTAGLFSRDKENVVRREISQASAPGRFAF
jgi:hypothetical protein